MGIRELKGAQEREKKKKKKQSLETKAKITKYAHLVGGQKKKAERHQGTKGFLPWGKKQRPSYYGARQIKLQK